MKVLRAAALGAALLSSSVWAFGQDYHSWQYQDRDDRGIYKQGYEQGRSDAQNGRRLHSDSDRYREGDDRRAYQEGYQAGYNSARNRGDSDRDGDRDRDRDHDRDGDHDRNGGPGNGNYGGYGNMSVARQNGFRDGVSDGSHDRATGHSFRPTHDDNYKNAPGYSSSMGDRQQYKNAYREAYGQGYPQGYNGRR
jgi:hypothetical protein